ncbi:MAG: endolytic transglycosylase MltG [Deltaproteobacteria bacterium]|nr:endolytic transglycosylase MltG [Deltaproteobacteria bacterium]
MKKILRLFLVLTFLAGLAAAYGSWTVMTFVDGEVTPPGGRAELTIAPGSSLRTIAKDLDAAGVIEDTRMPGVGSVFHLWAHRLERAGPKVKAGEYLFEGPASPRKVLEIITKGQVRTYQVTIPEGLRLDEIMPLFEAAGLGKADALLAVARDRDFVRSLGIPADDLEGYVYPETYTFAKGVSAKKILARTVERFDAAYERAAAGANPPVKLDRHEMVTLASIVEKETGAPEERPRIACVFYNRLQQDWKLQTDPTVIYAKILWSGGTWDGNLSRADLERDHPYSTYARKGLPPGPIASPGGKALEAVMNPMKCKDMFFVAKGGGLHEFCVDYACHLKAIDRYQKLGK